MLWHCWLSNKGFPHTGKCLLQNVISLPLGDLASPGSNCRKQDQLNEKAESVFVVFMFTAFVITFCVVPNVSSICMLILCMIFYVI